MKKISLKVNKKIEEISTAGGTGGGSIEGYAGVKRMSSKNKEKLIKRYEEGLKKQEEIFRRYVRGKIKTVLKEIDEKELTQNTGTNKAIEALEKFVKNLPAQYMALASDPKQRLSYASHYLQIVKDMMVSVLTKYDINLDVASEPFGYVAGGEDIPQGEERIKLTQDEPAPEPEEEVAEEPTEADEETEEPEEMVTEQEEPDEVATVEAEPPVEEPEEEEVQIGDKETITVPEIPGMDAVGKNESKNDVKIAIPHIRAGLETLASAVAGGEGGDLSDLTSYIKTIITQLKLRFNSAERELTGTDALPLGQDAQKTRDNVENIAESDSIDSIIKNAIIESVRKNV